MKCYIEFNVYDHDRHILCCCGEPSCYQAIEATLPERTEQRIWFYPDLSEYRAGRGGDSMQFHLPYNFKLVEVQEVAPLDTPDGPGWWAFEGRFNEEGAENFRYIFEVHEVDIFGVTHLFAVISNDEVNVLNLTGKWWRIETPWAPP